MTAMTPVDWAKLPLQKFTQFTGRAPRAEYWWYTLALIIVMVIVSIIESIVGLKGMIGGVYGPLTLLVALGTIVPSIAVAIRRLHDTNRSGWWLLLLAPYVVSVIMMLRAAAAATVTGVAPGFGAAGILGLVGLACCIALLVFYCLPGTAGDNRYGPDPYGGSAA